MSWRLVATVMVAMFVILTLSVTTAQPIRTATESITGLDGGDDSNQLDDGSIADAGVRAYENLFLVLSFGLIAYGGWYLLRRELSAGRL